MVWYIAVKNTQMFFLALKYDQMPYRHSEGNPAIFIKAKKCALPENKLVAGKITDRGYRRELFVNKKNDSCYYRWRSFENYGTTKAACLVAKGLHPRKFVPYYPLTNCSS